MAGRRAGLDRGVKMEFSDMVKEVRRKLKLSQKQLAQALNVSYATIKRWENNHVVPSNLAQKSFIDFCENNFIDISPMIKSEENSR